MKKRLRLRKHEKTAGNKRTTDVVFSVRENCFMKHFEIYECTVGWRIVHVKATVPTCCCKIAESEAA